MQGHSYLAGYSMVINQAPDASSFCPGVLASVAADLTRACRARLVRDVVRQIVIARFSTICAKAQPLENFPSASGSGSPPPPSPTSRRPVCAALPSCLCCGLSDAAGVAGRAWQGMAGRCRQVHVHGLAQELHVPGRACPHR